MIEAVIFDMDGLMVDTERLCVDLWSSILKEKGMPAHREIAIHCIGMDHKRMQNYLATQLPDFDYMSVLNEVGHRSARYCRQYGVPIKPGLYELLDYLDSKKIPYGVATSTKSVSARNRLSEINILPRLRFLITGDMVENGKPEPDIFLMAVKSLNLSPANCLVLEDSAHGIMAAHQAGCKPMMIPDLKEPDEDTRSLLYAIGENLLDVISLLEKEMMQ